MNSIYRSDRRLSSYNFERGKTLFDGQVAVLEQKANAVQKEIEGLKVQRKSRLDQLNVFREEIIGLRELNKKGFYPKSQLLGMERAMIQLEGFIGSDTASIARSERDLGNTTSNNKLQTTTIVVKFRPAGGQFKLMYSGPQRKSDCC